jgi:histidine triad (HIT) family protein
MTNTVFTKIISREIPAEIVYENDLILAFLDINPVHKGHTLVIPKESFRWFTDIPTELLEPLFKASQEISRAIKMATGASLIQLSIVGDEVPHVHIHLIPRYKDDNLNNWPKVQYKEGEAKEYAKNISNCINKKT